MAHLLTYQDQAMLICHSIIPYLGLSRYSYSMYLWFKQPWLFTEKRSPFLTEFIAKTTIDPLCTISSEMCPTSSKILQYIYYKKASCYAAHK